MTPTESANDIFYLIDFADGDVKAPLQLKERLAKETPPSWVKQIEVYRLDASIYYYNRDALLLSSQDYGIDVPRDRMQISRAGLPFGVEVFIKSP